MKVIWPECLHLCKRCWLDLWVYASVARGSVAAAIAVTMQHVASTCVKRNPQKRQDKEWQKHVPSTVPARQIEKQPVEGE